MSMSGSIQRTQHSGLPVVVVKTGGRLIDSCEWMNSLASDMGSLADDFTFVVVNGGGKEIDRLCAALSIPVEKVGGLRVTGSDVLVAVQMALARSSNAVASLLLAQGVRAVPMPAFSAGTVAVERRAAENGVDLGYVGRIASVDCTLIGEMQRYGCVPVIYPVASDRQHQLYNVNADEVASSIAVALGADALLMMTDVDGVLVGGAPRELLTSGDLSRSEIRGCFSDGMLPKLDAACSAANDGVAHVCIVDGRRRGSLRTYLKEGILNGTEIQK